MAKKAARANSSAAQKRQPAEIAVSNAPNHQAIAKRAFELYQLRGASPGDAVSDWLRAETELQSAQV
jgi:hypothetical protein